MLQLCFFTVWLGLGTKQHYVHLVRSWLTRLENVRVFHIEYKISSGFTLTFVENWFQPKTLARQLYRHTTTVPSTSLRRVQLILSRHYIMLEVILSAKHSNVQG